MLMKVLITVKAYPAISTKYGETVCTAGITEEGKWIRIYPVPFRLMEYDNQFKKYDWVEIDLVKRNSKKDFRPESYNPTEPYNINIKKIGHIDSDRDTWNARRQIVLNNVFTNLSELLNLAKKSNGEQCVSLAIFKPTEILDFICETTSRNWSKNQTEYMKSQKLQLNMFEQDDIYDISSFEEVEKVPYKFSYKFVDDSGKTSKLMIEDWETGMLYWNSFLRHNGDENKACDDVRKKYWDEFVVKKDLFFFLGTRYKEHVKNYPNPFSIIGTFHPNPIIQDSLF